MSNKTNLYENLVNEILGYWREFEIKEDKEKTGRALENLLEVADTFCQACNWQEAEKCCEMGLDLLRENWEGSGGRMNRTFAGAVAQFYLGAIYVGQAKLDTAGDYYRASAFDFNAVGAYVNASIAWLSLGRIYRVRKNWVKSLWAYQSSLNAIFGEHTPTTRNTRIDQLQELVERELQSLRDEVKKSLHGVPRVIPLFDRRRADLKGAGILGIPVVREIAAGQPISTGEAITAQTLDPDNIIDEIYLDEEHAKEAVFALKVQGESMVDAGINNGDYVFIRSQRTANNGEIAVVKIMRSADEEKATLKKYYKEDNHIRLQPMNSREKPLIVVPPQESRDSIETYYREKKGVEIEIIQTRDVEIVGKVVVVWRAVAG